VSEPDKAILWARERAARWQDESGGEAGPSYRSGKLDFLLGEEVEGYRAGQAASAERIKALEGLLNHAEDLFDWAAQSDCENGVRSLNKAAAATYLADAPATKAAILEIRELTRALHVKEPAHD
jgi:hypothetical protein